MIGAIVRVRNALLRAAPKAIRTLRHGRKLRNIKKAKRAVDTADGLGNTTGYTKTTIDPYG